VDAKGTPVIVELIELQRSNLCAAQTTAVQEREYRGVTGAQALSGVVSAAVKHDPEFIGRHGAAPEFSAAFDSGNIERTLHGFTRNETQPPGLLEHGSNSCQVPVRRRRRIELLKSTSKGARVL
jgi:hypothetical protein